MERRQQHPWVQVIGPIAVRRPGREPQLLTGASRVLLAILVAAGPEGTSVDEIAAAYWPETRPDSWRIALRIAASHLTTTLPSGWRVAIADDRFRLVVADGFVDAWRLEQEFAAPTARPHSARWLGRGRPYDGITGIELVDRAVDRIVALLPHSTAQESSGAVGTDLDDPVVQTALLTRLRRSPRVVVSARTDDHARISDLLRAGSDAESHLVIGDRGLLLPLGPYAMTFPELRNELDIAQGRAHADAASTAHRILGRALGAGTARGPQILLVARAHELDTMSLRLTSMLVNDPVPFAGSVVVLVDLALGDIRLLDFVERARRSGADIVDPIDELD